MTVYDYAWLDYRKNNELVIPFIKNGIFFNKDGKVVRTAILELQEALEKILEEQVDIVEQEENAGICFILDNNCSVLEEGYSIKVTEQKIYICSTGEKGLLYGTFELIRRIQTMEQLECECIVKNPDAPLRMLNHWDNMDGSIERGYSGDSFFFKNEKVIVNDRTRYYARLAASVGINGVVINNVNVKGNATKLIEDTYEQQLKEMEEIFADYGISLFLSLNFASPMELSKLETADPCNEDVIAWWKEKMEEVYKRIPRLGGFLVKADSEGRPGPFTYGRTHTDGANMLADAIKPYGGIIIWRCFVYNCQQDWRDRTIDRAKAGYDNFISLDGTFRENVILQIKNGPMDFQVREPVSPLFGGLEATNQMLEVQIAQEYTGQQKHVCYLLPMFGEILKFKTYCKENKDSVQDIITGKTFGNQLSGIAAVANTGDDENWTGHDLAAANFFGFGRLSYDMSLSPEEIAKEWICCTFGKDKEIVETITTILMMSWKTYENYTSPLGIGWMVNPNHHYGPNVDGYEYDRWGTYHRADHIGIGVDRSEHGTNYVSQYREKNKQMYNNIDSCPEELLLFFHYIPYTYKLKTGKTLIQHIYDTHFEGVEQVEYMCKLWESLKDKIEEKKFKRVKHRLAHQLEHSKEWRDQINTYFYRKSMIKDEKNRVIY